MSHTSFSIAYDGPAVESGSMDVRDLAPALLALGQLFDAANSILNDEKTTISVNVQATSQGSFEVALDVVQGMGSQLVSIFSGETVTAALQLKELVLVGGGAGVGGLIWLVKTLRGTSPKELVKTDEEVVRVTHESGTIEVPVDLLRLYGDLAVRHALERLVKEPLSKEGIDAFEVREEGVSVESVSVQESDYFSKPDTPDEIVLKNKHTAAYSIVSLAFKEDNKWRLHDGSAAISALMADAGFLRRVGSNQVAFAKGDILICEVETIQRRDGEFLKAEHTVAKVIEHRAALRQLDLPVESGRAIASEPM